MPHEITFKQIPLGHAAAATRVGDDTVSVQSIGFTSTEDGQVFVEYLEKFPDDILNMLASQRNVNIRPSELDHLLAIIQRDRKTTVYINEITPIYSARVSRAMNKGEAVFKNDIVDIGRMNLGNIEIPSDAGVIFLFSVGWRKGLFYDFSPLNPNEDVRREFDCSVMFGQLLAHVLFQERFRILEPEWEGLFKSKLFPFAALKIETINKIINYIRESWDPTELSDLIVAEVRGQIPVFLNAWKDHYGFKPHYDMIDCAVDRFLNGDYISCINSLMPRIEGILRSHHVAIGRTDKPTQSTLADSAVSAKVSSSKSLLLPHRFQEYLKRVYFAGFSKQVKPCDPEIKLSRHSVSHGVAPPEYFTALNAAISILVLHQLFYCFEPESGEDNTSL
jgi:hypothetical protein